ncbi:MAG: hypothetical protein LBR70_03260 [Lactobacillaceae bacterium]|nr:hypothetical protein [Lactobacillaceae bacterium]
MEEYKLESYDDYINFIKPANFDEADFAAMTKSEKIKILKLKKKLFNNEKELTKEILKTFESKRNKLKKGKKEFDELLSLLDKAGIEFKTQEFNSLTRAEKRVIRMDYYGSTTKPDPELLSDFYSRACKNPGNKNRYKPEDYDLSTSPSWLLFRQFKNFRNIETRVKRQLSESGVNPQDLKNMAVEDYTDVIHNQFKRAEDDENAPMFLGAKYSFVKDFIKNFEKPFVKILEDVGVDKRYIKELVKNMKSKGMSENFRVFDENGIEIKGPRISVHHKIAVNEANSKSKMGEINLFENLCLCIDDPYHGKIIHRLDKSLNENGRLMRNSMAFKNKNVVFVGGLSPIQQLDYDYTNDPRTKRAQNNVFYYDGSFITNDTEELREKIAARKIMENIEKEKSDHAARRAERFNKNEQKPKEQKSLAKARFSIQSLRKSMRRR